MSKIEKVNRVRLKLGNSRTGSVTGFRTLNGIEFLEISYCGATGHVPRLMFLDPHSAAKHLLAEQNVVVISKKDWAEIIEGVEDIDGFPTKPMVDRLGWSEPYFAFRDGKVSAPVREPKPRLVSSIVTEGVAKSGSLRRWRNDIATPLAGQTLPMVAILAALAAPLLRYSGLTHNPGLEFCGPKGKGKTLLLRLATSISDSPSQLPTFDATRIGLSKLSESYQDRIFPVDEGSHVDRSDNNFYQAFVFGMASGTSRVTAFRTDLEETRFILITSANRPYHESLSHLDMETRAAALDRLLPLAVDPKNELGIFDFLPDAFATSGEFARHIEQRMQVLFGMPIRRLIHTVVNARARDADAFHASLNDDIREFEATLGVAASTQGRTRPSSTFGLFFAVGQIAKRRNILPDTWDCMAACVAAYRNYQAQLPECTPLTARLAMIASRPETLNLCGRKPPRLTDEQVDRHGAFIRQGKNGRTELLLTDATTEHYFPDWRSLSMTSEFKSLNLRDADHRTKQRQVRASHKKERFVCFVLPGSIVKLLER